MIRAYLDAGVLIIAARGIGDASDLEFYIDAAVYSTKSLTARNFWRS